MSDLENLESQDNQLKGSLNTTKSKLEEVYKNYKPFSNREIQFLKEVAQTKWAVLQEKVNNLAEEVFDEVI